MTFYENSSLERGLDTMFMVYSLLDGHPASLACEQFITSRQGWVNTPLLVIEGMAIMIKVYGVEPEIACQLATDFAYGPISILPIELEIITAAVDLSILHDVDINDAVLLQACIEQCIFMREKGGVPYETSRNRRILSN
jgi:predicted nucleic acid-binding protein